jgi:hypothetical protein
MTANKTDIRQIRYHSRDIRQCYLEPQVEQLVAEQPPQEELAVLLNFPPLEKAKVDIIR